jgi:hypothetical protein
MRDPMPQPSRPTMVNAKELIEQLYRQTDSKTFWTHHDTRDVIICVVSCTLGTFIGNSGALFVANMMGWL